MQRFIAHSGRRALAPPSRAGFDSFAKVQAQRSTFTQQRASLMTGAVVRSSKLAAFSHSSSSALMSSSQRIRPVRASANRARMFSGEAKTVAGKGDRVYVNIVAKDAETGEALFDTQNEPISFIVGLGQVIVGLDRRILGTNVGETWTEVFEPAEAFGVVDPNKYRKIAKPSDPEMLKELTVGATVQLQTGEMARIMQVAEDFLIIDMNSSMAGRKVTFTVTLDRIENEINNVMSGVQVQTLKAGDGKTYPKAGSRVSVHYTGTLAESGKEFDSSRRGNRPPFSFVLGAGLVIRGWDVGIGKLSLGERATLHIPAEMGYGAQGAGGVIPPNANLIFDVELVEIDGIKASSSL